MTPSSALSALMPALAAEAATAWPGVEVDGDRYRAFLAERLADPDDVSGSIAELWTTDLYLACACAARVPAAIATFERVLLPVVDVVVKRMRAPASVADEVKQALRARLLVPGEDRPAQIVDYRGRGPLASWLKVVALREALAVQRRTARDHGVAATPDALVELPGDDPRLRMIKNDFAGHFRDALQQALAALSTRDRSLIRLHNLDQVGVEALGVANGVHAGTISRWLARARAAVRAGVERHLRRTLAVDANQLDSLMRLVDTNLEASLATLFRDGESTQCRA